jgi:hypothetical protein
MLKLASARLCAASLTITVMLSVPDHVGVPEITPLELNCNPAGNSPL